MYSVCKNKQRKLAKLHPQDVEVASFGDTRYSEHDLVVTLAKVLERDLADFNKPVVEGLPLPFVNGKGGDGVVELFSHWATCTIALLVLSPHCFCLIPIQISHYSVMVDLLFLLFPFVLFSDNASCDVYCPATYINLSCIAA